MKNERKKLHVKAFVDGRLQWVHVCYIDRTKFNLFFKSQQDVIPWLKVWAEKDCITFEGRTSTIEGIHALRDAVVAHQRALIEPIVGVNHDISQQMQNGIFFRTWIENHIEEELTNGTNQTQSDP